MGVMRWQAYPASISTRSTHKPYSLQAVHESTGARVSSVGKLDTATCEPAG